MKERLRKMKKVGEGEAGWKDFLLIIILLTVGILILMLPEA